MINHKSHMRIFVQFLIHILDDQDNREEWPKGIAQDYESQFKSMLLGQGRNQGITFDSRIFGGVSLFHFSLCPTILISSDSVVTVNKMFLSLWGTRFDDEKVVVGIDDNLHIMPFLFTASTSGCPMR